MNEYEFGDQLNTIFQFSRQALDQSWLTKLEITQKVWEEFFFEKFNINVPTSLVINYCSLTKIIELNKSFRQKDKPTDVLSFPIQESIREDDYDKFLPEIELGDIYICEEVCKKQASNHNINELDEFIHLATHGFLHLCGYDHELNSEEDELMRSLEAELIEQISDHS